jgi:hypothetical protein
VRHPTAKAGDGVPQPDRSGWTVGKRTVPYHNITIYTVYLSMWWRRCTPARLARLDRTPDPARLLRTPSGSPPALSPVAGASLKLIPSGIFS